MSEIKKIYLAHFLAGLATAASVTWTLYFLSHEISQSQIGLLFAVFMIALSILDIPTGSFADIFGHKASVGLGLFFHSLSFFFFFLFPTFNGFLIGMILAGLGLALQSGAWSSLIYDILKKLSKTDDFQKVQGRANGYFLTASIFASPIGSIIFKNYPRLPNFLAFIFILSAGLVVYLIKWEFTKKPHTVFTFIKKIQEGTVLTIKNRRLVAIVLMGIALTVSRMLFNQNISQPYQLLVGVDVAFIGFTAAAFAAIQAFISINAYKIYKKFGVSVSLFLIVFIPSLCTLVLSFFNSLYALAFIMFFYMGHAFREPVFATIGQGEVSDKHRATMASTVSFLTSISVGLLLPFWGHGIDLYGIKTILIILAFFTASVGTLGIYIFESKKQ